MGIKMLEHDVAPRNGGVQIQVNTHTNAGAAELSEGSSVIEPIDLSGRKRYALSFMDEVISISLRYTLPALISVNESNGIEFVSLKFQRLGDMVVVYGSLGLGNLVRRVCFDIRRYLHIVDLLMGTLESEKEDTLSIHKKVLKCWGIIKDGLVTPLLIDLYYKSSLELPPCFMCLPPELKRKVTESLSGVNIAILACVSSELRDLVADNDSWKQKCMEEFRDRVTEGDDVVNWKEKFAKFLENQACLHRHNSWRTTY